MPSACSFLLGLDVFMHLFDNESHRLAFNLLTISVVSFLAGPCYYTLSDDGDDVTFSAAFFPFNSDSYPWYWIPLLLLLISTHKRCSIHIRIATGYMVLGCFCLAYIVLYVFTCCTCNCMLMIEKRASPRQRTKVFHLFMQNTPGMP